MSFGMPVIRPLVAALACALALPLLATPLSLPDAQRRALERSRQLDAHDASVNASLRDGARRGPASRSGVAPRPRQRARRRPRPLQPVARLHDDAARRRLAAVHAQGGPRPAARALRARGRPHPRASGLRAPPPSSATPRSRGSIAITSRRCAPPPRDWCEASAAQVQSAESMYRGGRGSQAEVFGTRAAVALARDRLRRYRAPRARGGASSSGDGPGLPMARPLGPLPDMTTVRLGEGPLEDHLSTHPEIVSVDREARRDGGRGSHRRCCAHPRLDLGGRLPAARLVVLEHVLDRRLDAAAVGHRPTARIARSRRSSRRPTRIHARRDEMLRAHVAEVRAMLDEWRVGRERQARYRDEILPLARERTSASLAAYAGAQRDARRGGGGAQRRVRDAAAGAAARPRGRARSGRGSNFLHSRRAGARRRATRRSPGARDEAAHA